MLHTHRHEDGIWKVTHEMELLPGEWQTRMKTKNTVGWSKFSTPYIFTIQDDEEDDEGRQNASEKFSISDNIKGSYTNLSYWITRSIMTFSFCYSFLAPSSCRTLGKILNKIWSHSFVLCSIYETDHKIESHASLHMTLIICSNERQ